MGCGACPTLEQENKRNDRFMSSIFDKKNDNKENDKVSRREERTRKEQQESRKIRRIAIIVTTIFVLFVAAAVFLNSRFVRQSLTAITIGGVDFTAAEFDFFYNNAAGAYQEEMNSLHGDYASLYLPISGMPLSNQIKDYDTEETWADFFFNETIEHISDQVKRYNAARNAGYVLPDDMFQAIDELISEYRMYAEMYGQPSLDAFIHEYVGRNMNERTLRKVLEFVYTAESYSEHVRDSFVFETQVMVDYYADNRDRFDIFTYRYFLVLPEDVPYEDFETDEELEEAQEAALEEAAARAAQIVADLMSEEDYDVREEEFITIAQEFSEDEYDEFGFDEYEDPDPTLYTVPGAWLSSQFDTWLQDDERSRGDVEAIDAGFGSYIIFFVERDSNEYRMVEMNQILIMREVVEEFMFLEGVDDPEYIEALENAAAEARRRADEVMDMFISRGQTKEALIELIEEGFSDDMTEDGFFDRITKDPSFNGVVPEIEEWLFAPERQVGDIEMIETEEYGYHLVFFSGFGERYCDFLAAEELRDQEYERWADALAPVDFVKRWAFIFTWS